jgi:hypothetical protein
MTRLTTVLASAAVLSAAMIGSAAAMPAAPLASAAQTQSGIQQARWVCGPYRCWWRPNYYGYYGPRPYHYGWHRHWHRW